MIKVSDLNPEQRDAATSINGPIMILAGAGTGKTRVITYRIGYMLDRGIRPEAIVALSFTNKAAREMQERVRHLCGPRSKDVRLGTFHSFCLNILRQNHRALGLPSRFGLAGTSDQIDLIRRGLEEKGWTGNYDVEEMHFKIGVAKNHLLSPKDLKEGKGHGLIHGDMRIVSEVYELYERQLKLNHVIDFDDCIYKTVRVLKENPDVRAKLREQYRYFMVDEFQDTNGAQLAVMEQLASDGHDVCVVGDDDQSIYSWRGAMYEILEKFEELFPKTRLIKLEQNYRCSNVILDAANTVIKHNTQRKDKTLWSASEETTPILLTATENEVAEANFVAEKIIGLLGAGYKPEDVGILYRANAQAKALELALREARIPYRTFGGQSFFERKEVKDFTCYLRLVLNSGDNLALWRIINSPNRGIGLTTLEKIGEQASAARKAPYTLIASGGFAVGGAADRAVQGFVQMMHKLKAMPLETPADYEALGQAILKDTGLESDVRLKTKDEHSKDKKVQNLRSLPKWLATLAEDVLKEHGKIDKDAILDIFALDNDRREDKDKGKNYASLMTIHAAKGLEFPAVFVVGVEEDLLPHKNSILDPRAVSEERRLFYVALTRAKQRLYLSYCSERTSTQQRSLRMPSRFLKELPKATYVTDDSMIRAQVQQTKEERKQQTVSRLSSLKASLSTGKW